MRYALIVAAASLGLSLVSPPAHAVGCLSGGAAGALAGHMAGHGILGALGGCIAGRAWHNHTVRQQDLQNQQNYVQRRQQYDPNYKNPWAD
jgi:outer membrane lipoprotein SlyB